MNKFSPHKQSVVERFSHQASGYTQHAALQKRVAARLAHLFPQNQPADILEIGCGTGFLTHHLLATYPEARMHITDLSLDMLDQCRKNIGAPSNLHYALMDGEQPDHTKRYDLIVTGMTVQWFDQPEKSLLQLQSLLKSGGVLVYSTPGPKLFPQWRQVLGELHLPCGLLNIPELPGEIFEERYQMQFASGVDFLKSLKATGASTPRPDYRSLSMVEMRRAIHLFETKMASPSGRLAYSLWPAARLITSCSAAPALRACPHRPDQSVHR